MTKSQLVARLAAEEAGEGVRRIALGAEAAFLRPLPVTRLEGVGQKTASTLEEHGARTIGEVAALGRERLETLLGVHGLRIFAAGDFGCSWLAWHRILLRSIPGVVPAPGRPTPARWFVKARR